MGGSHKVRHGLGSVFPCLSVPALGFGIGVFRFRVYRVFGTVYPGLQGLQFSSLFTWNSL